MTSGLAVGNSEPDRVSSAPIHVGGEPDKQTRLVPLAATPSLWLRRVTR